MAVNTTRIGSWAERRVADEMISRGFEVVELNWRRSDCEIDIVCKKVSGRLRKETSMVFVEVKYRRHAKSGSGFESISPGKLRQMAYAAQRWQQENDYDGAMELWAAQVDGSGTVEIVPIED